MALGSCDADQMVAMILENTVPPRVTEHFDNIYAAITLYKYLRLAVECAMSLEMAGDNSAEM